MKTLNAEGLLNLKGALSDVAPDSGYMAQWRGNADGSVSILNEDEPGVEVARICPGAGNSGIELGEDSSYMHRIENVRHQNGVTLTTFVCGISANNLSDAQQRFIAALFERERWPDIEAAHIAAFPDRTVSVDGDLTLDEMCRVHRALHAMPEAMG